MRKHLVTALALLVFASVAGCDLAEEDPEEALFIGTWSIAEIDADRTDYTEFILARYESAVIAFFDENDDFNIILDVNDTPDDIFIDGEFDVDSGDGELDLFSAAFGGGFDFDYTFDGNDTLYLETDDDDPVLQTLFGVNLDVDQVFIVLERRD